MKPTESYPLIEVPVVSQLPTDSAGALEVVAFTDFLQTKLLKPNTAILRADISQSSGRWFVSSPVEGGKAQVEEFELDQKYFRIILSRVGHHYMNNQLYGGYS